MVCFHADPYHQNARSPRSGETFQILQLKKKITVRVTHKEWLPTREIKLVKNCYPHRDIRRLAFVT